MLAFLSYNRSFMQDEIESVHVAWKIFSGQRIYVDFFEHHHPFFYYMLVPLIRMLGENTHVLIAARGLVFLMLLLIFAVTYNLAKNLFGKESALISVVLLAATKVFISTAIEIRADVPQTLFGLLAIFLLFKFFDIKSLKYLVLSSFSLGISFLFLQKSIFLIFILGVILFLSARNKEIRFKDPILYLLILVVTLSPYYLYLFFSGQFNAYIKYNWLVNIVIVKAEPAWFSVHAITLLLSSFHDSSIIWILWLLSFLFLNKPNQERLGAISLFLIIVFISLQSSSWQYLLPVIPLIVIMAGFGLNEVTSFFFKSKILFIWLAVLISTFSIFYQFSKFTANIKQMKRMEYVVGLTKQKDFVYDECENSKRTNLFRNDLEFLWMATGSAEGLEWLRRGAPERQDSLYDLIERFKPRVIVKSNSIDMKDRRVMQYYRQSVQYPDLFIRIK